MPAARATVVIDARDAFEPRPRGWARYTKQLVAALAARDDGFEYDLIERGTPGPELLFEQAVLPRRLRGAGLVHSPNCFLPLRRPCPGVVTVHDLAFEEHPGDFSRRTGLKYRALAPRAARSAERVICVSEFTRDDLCERYAIDPDKTRVILSAPALPAGEAEPPEGPYLLAIGDLRPKKNLLRLVEAFRELHADGMPQRLILAGVDTGEGARLRAAAGDAPVELTGWVSDDGLDALIRGADLLVHPSLYEGFGLVIVEAMARGCPVAAARATALPETAGRAAVLFDPLDTRDMVDAIRSLLEDEGRREELIERGRERVAALSWDETARATAAVYRELLG